MKPLFYLLSAIFLSFQIYGQNCKCEKELSFVIDYYETNLPGFSDNVKDSNRFDYESFKDILRENSRKSNLDSDCFKLLTYYVEFFQDNHSEITMNVPFVDDKNEKELKKFLNSKVFKQTEKIDVSQIEQLKLDLNDEIIGEYFSIDSIYKIIILPNKNNLRDYVGVILESKTPMWNKSQLKFELKRTSDSTYNLFAYNRNHSVRYIINVKLENGILADEWYKSTLKSAINYKINAPNKLVYELINDSTNYIYIPTFSGNWTAKLDSFYHKYDSIIRLKPFLIIDVRNNGGGSDSNVNPLLNYIYTKPYYTDNVQLYVTKENIRKSEEWYEFHKKDTSNFSREFLYEIIEEIDKMKNAKENSFISRVEHHIVEFDSILTFPRKVAVISNRYCASACESLLFYARESDKTLILGENSGGFVGYGEIGQIKTPNYGFNLGCTMTRYENSRKFEATGVPVDIHLDNESDWIMQTLNYLYK